MAKKVLRLKRLERYLPLIHKPGDAQADFCYTDFYEKRKLYHEAKYLILSFLYSNGGYPQLKYAENMESLMEGLVAMLEYIVVFLQKSVLTTHRPLLPRSSKTAEKMSRNVFNDFVSITVLNPSL